MGKYPSQYALASGDELVFGFDHFYQLFTYLCLYPNVVRDCGDFRVYRFSNGVKTVHPFMVVVTPKLKPLSFQVRYYKSYNGYVMYVGSTCIVGSMRARALRACADLNTTL